METTEPPVEAGDIRTVTIETTGDEGDGIARVGDGYTLLVPGAAEGETVTVEVESPVFESYAFATVMGTDESPQDDPQADIHAQATTKYDVEASHGR